MFVTLDTKALAKAEDIAEAIELADCYLQQSSNMIISHEDDRFLFPVFNVDQKPQNNVKRGVLWREVGYETGKELENVR